VEGAAGLPMKSVLLAICFALAIGVPAMAGGANYSTLTVEQLIDQLTEVNDFGPGLNSMGWYEGFIAEDKPLHFDGGVLGAPESTVPPQMRELVRRGAVALPLLLQHLSDARPTKLVVGTDTSKKNGFFFMFEYFSDEYMPREPSRQPRVCEKKACLEKPLDGAYTVRVGDVCFSIVGQIVSRRMDAVRYQPTAGLIINSPVETPALAESIRADWQNTGPDELKSALIADLHRTTAIEGAPGAERRLFQYPALARLRFYYLSAYAALTGKEAKLRADFEADLRKGN
jgi:hypothetical protein